MTIPFCCLITADLAEAGLDRENEQVRMQIVAALWRDEVESEGKNQSVQLYI